MKKKRYGLVVFFLIAASAAFGADPKPVLLDVDPGIDDTMAILLALRSPELQVEGITVVAGNVPVDQGVVNTLKILALGGRGDIPVARGAAAPLVGKLTTSKHVHGEFGMGDVELPTPDLRPYEGTAIDLIVSKVEQHPGEITLIPLGPLTNIAMALRLRPDLVPKIKEIVLMGGAIFEGNITPAAEFNIYNDPEAANIVFASGVPIVMVGLDVTTKTVFESKYWKDFEGSADPVGRLVLSLNGYYKRNRGSDILMHDPLAVGVAIDPSFVTSEAAYVEVETRGDKTRGETVVNRRGFRLRFEEGPQYKSAVREDIEPNARICLDVIMYRSAQNAVRK